MKNSIRVEIDVRKSSALALIASRGAGHTFSHAHAVIDDSMVLPCTHGDRRPVPPWVQLKWLQSCMSAPKDPWWLVIGSAHDEEAAMAVAAGIMLRAAERSLASPEKEMRPLMWPLYGGSRDRLRDDNEFRDGMGGIGMLVLTNLTDNSTLDKMEKARDLLHMFRERPRVLIVSGADPLDFAKTRLHAVPNRVLHLGRDARKKIWRV